MRYGKLFSDLSAPGWLVVVAVLDAGVGAGDQLCVLDDLVLGVEAAAVRDQDGGAALDAELAGLGRGRRAGGQPVFSPGGLVARYLAVGVIGAEQGGAGSGQRGRVPGRQ